MIESNIDCA